MTKGLYALSLIICSTNKILLDNFSLLCYNINSSKVINKRKKVTQ